MAKNHYTSKTKRRPKSGKRKDQGAETMKRLKEHEQAEVQAVGSPIALTHPQS